MSILKPSFTDEIASNAMLDGLTSRIRAELKEIILARIEPDIEAAIDVSMKAFEAAIYSYRDYTGMRDVVKVIIERKSSPASEEQHGEGK